MEVSASAPVDVLSPVSPPLAGQRGLAVRLSVTERCQLRCTYCMPEKGCGCVREQDRELSHDQIVRILSAIHASHGIRRIRFTGGEPLLRTDLPDLIASVKSLGIDDLSLTTNAQLLASSALRLKEAGLSRLNVSLDSVTPNVFSAITRGGSLNRTLEGIAAGSAAGLGPVKLNMVVVRGSNDQEVQSVLRYAMDAGHCLRFLELMPIGAGGTRFHEDFVSSAEVRERLIASGFELSPLSWDGHETSRDWRVKAPWGAEAVCGFISPTSHPFCDGCRRMRITSDGWVYGCLARNDRHDLNPLLGAPARVVDPIASLPLGPTEGSSSQAGRLAAQIIGQAFASKQGEKYTKTIPSMSMIGG